MHAEQHLVAERLAKQVKLVRFFFSCKLEKTGERKG